jgi:hypothetical protein
LGEECCWFIPCPKSLPMAKIKILVALIKKVKKKKKRSSIDFVLCITLMKSIFIKHSELRKEKYKM